MGEGGQAKVFKAKFHDKYVAMKYVPLDHVKHIYKYTEICYGCHEFYEQEKLLIGVMTFFSIVNFDKDEVWN